MSNESPYQLNQPTYWAQSPLKSATKFMLFQATTMMLLLGITKHWHRLTIMSIIRLIDLKLTDQLITPIVHPPFKWNKFFTVNFCRIKTSLLYVENPKRIENLVKKSSIIFYFLVLISHHWKNCTYKFLFSPKHHCQTHLWEYDVQLMMTFSNSIYSSQDNGTIPRRCIEMRRKIVPQYHRKVPINRYYYRVHVVALL